MTSASESLSASETIYSRRTDQNLETYFLIWLDALINSDENLAAQEKIRLSINYLETFDKLNECEKYIQSVSSEDRCILIVSGRFVQQLLPRIHHLQQIFSIYIYCENKEFHEQWSQQYRKIKGVHNQLDRLILQIQFNQPNRRQIIVDESSSPILIFNSKNSSETSTTSLNGRFVQSQLLISCLLKMKNTNLDKKEFFFQCREYYKGNDRELNKINEFEKDYDPEDCLWWYTRDTFLYRLLNKALRVENIDFLFLMRFFIRDIKEELHQHRCSSLIHVYRGQLISIDEINLFKDSEGQLISMNSFISTTLNRKIALMYLGSLTNDNSFERVLFQIDANPNELGVKSFANVSNFSQFPQEEEVLMMLGSIFRLKSISHDEIGQIWHVHIVLCSDNDCELQTIFHHMKNQYGSINTRLLLFANVLIDMANFNHAERYLRRLLESLPSYHKDIPKCYQALGKISCEKGNYQLSHLYFDQALEYLRKFQLNHSRIGYIYNNIGEVYQNQGDFKQALESYEKALNIFQKQIPNNEENLSWCYNNLGIIYEKQKNYSKALDYLLKSLNIKEKILPSQHPCLANTYNNIGNVYYYLGEYDQALKKYQFSYQIFQTSLNSQHPSIARVLRNIGVVYEAKKDFVEAKKSYEQAFEIRKYILSSSHSDLSETKQDIIRISLKIK